MSPDRRTAPAARSRYPRRTLVLIAVVVLVVAVTVTGVVLATRQGGNRPVAPGSPGGTTTSAQAPGTSGTVPSGPATTGPPSSPAPPAPGFAFQPLWPFAGVADAQSWQQSYRAGGHQPWHLDAGEVALAFTQGYLDYANVDKVISTSSSAGAAWVAVGFDNPNGSPVTAAVLHLVRISTGTDAPWEVVGTRDSTLSLTTPGYGSTVRSPVRVGGRITGVDESLTVTVHEPDQNAPVGQASGIPAGGTDAPWSTMVFARPTRGAVLTIAVATGGHIAAVERFAITGVRAG